MDWVLVPSRMGFRVGSGVSWALVPSRVGSRVGSGVPVTPLTQFFKYLVFSVGKTDS